MTRPALHFSGEPDLVTRMRALFPEQSTLRQRPEWAKARWHKFVLRADAQGRSLIRRAFSFHARRSA